MLWSFVALCLTPLGLLANALLLSGWLRTEQLGSRLCSISILIGNITLQLDKVCVLFASLLFGREAWRAAAADGVDDPQSFASASIQDRTRMTRWRHERNYWIALYVLTLWTVAWRVNYLLTVRKETRNATPAVTLTGELKKQR